MKIDKVIKKNSRDVLIQFNNSETLILSLDIFLKSGLKKNDEITQNRFSSLITENKKFHIKQRAYRLLGRRHHSVLELKLKLFHKDYEKKIIDDVLSELISDGYLDDMKFASMLVGEKLRTKSWGERKMKAELLKKGIDHKIITEVLKVHLTETEKITNAELLASKKLQILKLRNYEPKLLRQKLTSFLASRGYDYEIIKNVLNKIPGEHAQDD